MNYNEVSDYVRRNPEVGYRKLMKIFNVSQPLATKIKKEALSKSPLAQTDIHDKMLKILSSGPIDTIEVCNALDISPAKADNIMAELVDNGYILNKNGSIAFLDESLEKLPTYSIDYRKHGSNDIVFGAVADTHIGSKYERIDVLESLYDRFEEEGITTVFHGGNWIDGEARFNRSDIYSYGLGDQVKNFIDKYPHRNGMTTHIISGDDHEGWYVQREKINIGKYMEMTARDNGRTDLIDAGYMERDFNLVQKSGSATLRLAHLGGGSAYATSYSAQKYMESLQGGEKPQIVLIGHYHKFEYGYPREVHTIQLGAVQDQTPFMRKRRLQSMLGGCIIRIKQADNGIILSLSVQWMPYYDKKFYEYKW